MTAAAWLNVYTKYLRNEYVEIIQPRGLCIDVCAQSSSLNPWTLFLNIKLAYKRWLIEQLKHIHQLNINEIHMYETILCYQICILIMYINNVCLIYWNLLENYPIVLIYSSIIFNPYIYLLKRYSNDFIVCSISIFSIIKISIYRFSKIPNSFVIYLYITYSSKYSKYWNL